MVLREGAVSLHDLAVAHTERALDPNFLGSPIIIEGYLDPVSVGRPARSRREVTGRHRTEFVDAEDRRRGRRLGVERDNGGPCGTLGTKSGSLLVAHRRVRRQRTPSCRKMRRTWLRATRMPRTWALTVSASRVHSDSPVDLGSPVRQCPHFAPSTVHIFGFPLPPQIQAISGLRAILSQQHQRREIATDRMSFPLSALESSSSLLTYQGLGHRAISIVGCYEP